MEFEDLPSHEDLLIDDSVASGAIIERLTQTMPREAISKFLRTRHFSDQMSSVLVKISYLDEVIDGVEGDTIHGSVFVGGVLACMVMEEVALRNKFPRQEVYARWLTNEVVDLRSLGYGEKSVSTVKQMRKESRDRFASDGMHAFDRLPEHLRNVVGSYYVNADRYNDLKSVKIGYGRTLSNLSEAFEGCYSDTMDVELMKMLNWQ